MSPTSKTKGSAHIVSATVGPINVGKATTEFVPSERSHRWELRITRMTGVGHQTIRLPPFSEEPFSRAQRTAIYIVISKPNRISIYDGIVHSMSAPSSP